MLLCLFKMVDIFDFFLFRSIRYQKTIEILFLFVSFHWNILLKYQHQFCGALVFQMEIKSFFFSSKTPTELSLTQSIRRHVVLCEKENDWETHRDEERERETEQTQHFTTSN